MRETITTIQKYPLRTSSNSSSRLSTTPSLFTFRNYMQPLNTLYTTRKSQTILKHTSHIEASTLPNLKPSHFLNRDIADHDYDVASILNTDIHVYLNQEEQPLQKGTFQTLPIPLLFIKNITITPNGHQRLTVPPILLYPLPASS